MAWQTPTTKHRTYTRDGGQKGAERPDLAGQASAWPTATTADAEQTRRYMRGNLSLGMAAKTWPTVTSSDADTGPGQAASSEGSPNLRTAVTTWATPRASPNENRNTKPAPSHGNGHGQTLAGQSMAWPTPRVPNGGRMGEAEQGLRPAGAKRSVSLESMSVVSSPSLLDLMTETVGPDTSPPSRALNLRFVETLMGWPVGWSDFGSWGTAWSLLRELSPS